MNTPTMSELTVSEPSLPWMRLWRVPPAPWVERPKRPMDCTASEPKPGVAVLLSPARMPPKSPRTFTAPRSTAPPAGIDETDVDKAVAAVKRAGRGRDLQAQPVGGRTELEQVDNLQLLRRRVVAVDAARVELENVVDVSGIEQGLGNLRRDVVTVYVLIGQRRGIDRSRRGEAGFEFFETGDVPAIGSAYVFSSLVPSASEKIQHDVLLSSLEPRLSAHTGRRGVAQVA